MPTRCASRSSTTRPARTRTAARSRRRSCAGSSATTCSRTAGTTSATTFSSTSTARSSRAAGGCRPQRRRRARAGVQPGLGRRRADRDLRLDIDHARGARRARSGSSPGGWTWRTSIRFRPLSWRSTGNPKFPAGRMITLRTISGHKDTGYTSCPGSNSTAPCRRSRLRSRRRVSQALLPDRHGRTRRPCPVHRDAHEPLPWTVTVSQRDANVIAEGSGEGTEIDWTWDARTIPAGSYLYAIDAGPTVRPATGFVAGTTSRSMLTALANRRCSRRTATAAPTSRRPLPPRASPRSSPGRSSTRSVSSRRRSSSSQKTNGSYAVRWDADGHPRREVRDRALGEKCDRDRDDRDAGDDRRSHDSPATRSRRRFSRRTTTAGSTSTRFSFTLDEPAAGRRSPIQPRETKTVGQVFSGQLQPGPSRSTGTAASGAESASTCSGPTCVSTSPVATIRERWLFATDTTGPQLNAWPRAASGFSSTSRRHDGRLRRDADRHVAPPDARASSRFGPGGPFTSFAAVARDFAGNDGRPLRYP